MEYCNEEGAMGAWDFLPGALAIERGVWGDYLGLARFHYRAGRPATVAGVWTARYREAAASARVAAVGVLSWPTICCGGRERYFGLRGLSCAERARFANANLRTISRVIVHPQFRGIGVASALIRLMCHQCPTRYIEALAVMGRGHPMFEAAGMRRVAGEREGEAVYYVRECRSGSAGHSLPSGRAGPTCWVGEMAC
jgi:GNAT superfamily N-acetyltransferase